MLADGSPGPGNLAGLLGGRGELGKGEPVESPPSLLKSDPAMMLGCSAVEKDS